jgi:hypothetical protein
MPDPTSMQPAMAPISCLTSEDLEAYADPARRPQWLVKKMAFFCAEAIRTGASKETVASQIELLIHLSELSSDNA